MTSSSANYQHVPKIYFVIVLNLKTLLTNNQFIRDCKEWGGGGVEFARNVKDC